MCGSLRLMSGVLNGPPTLLVKVRSQWNPELAYMASMLVCLVGNNGCPCLRPKLWSSHSDGRYRNYQGLSRPLILFLYYKARKPWCLPRLFILRSTRHRALYEAAWALILGSMQMEGLPFPCTGRSKAVPGTWSMHRRESVESQ